MPDRFQPVANWWWDSQREKAVTKGEPDPGPLYRDTQHGKTATPSLFDTADTGGRADG